MEKQEIKTISKIILNVSYIILLIIIFIVFLYILSTNIYKSSKIILSKMNSDKINDKIIVVDEDEQSNISNKMLIDTNIINY